jgi:hypothetical protein
LPVSYQSIPFSHCDLIFGLFYVTPRSGQTASQAGAGCSQQAEKYTSAEFKCQRPCAKCRINSIKLLPEAACRCKAWGMSSPESRGSPSPRLHGESACAGSRLRHCRKDGACQHPDAGSTAGVEHYFGRRVGAGFNPAPTRSNDVMRRDVRFNHSHDPKGIALSCPYAIRAQQPKVCSPLFRRDGGPNLVAT